MTSRIPTSAIALVMTAVLSISLVTAAQAAPATAGESSGEAPGFAKERGISVAEAEQRLGWQIVAPDLAERLETELAETFGGIWIDVRDGDRVKIGVAPRVDPASEAVIKRAAAEVGLTEGYDVIDVPRTLATLTSSMSWLGVEIARVNPGAPVRLAAGVRTDMNVVQLSLPRGTLTSAQRELVDTAQRTLGSGLILAGYAGSFVPFACSYPYCDTPLHGGVKINYPGTYCSSAFTAQSKVDSVYYLITAGHCAYQHYSTWSTKFTDLSVHNLGPVHHWEWNAAGDMAIIRLTNPTGWSPKGWVQVTSGPDTTADDTYHISSDKLSVLGMRICVTGAAYGRSDQQA